MTSPLQARVEKLCVGMAQQIINEIIASPLHELSSLAQGGLARRIGKRVANSMTTPPPAASPTAPSRKATLPKGGKAPPGTSILKNKAKSKTAPRHIPHRSSAEEVQQMQQTILQSARKLTAKGDWVAVSDISRDAKVEVNKASRLLSQMATSGEVERRGTKKSTQYRALLGAKPPASPSPPADLEPSPASQTDEATPPT